jgi:hypothetical protein
MEKPRIFTTSFSSVYPFYIQKAEKKGRAKEDVDAVICWLTGYNQQTLQQQIDKNNNFETFFAQAPQINPNASKITGKICGYRVEEIEDKLMQKIRYLDKLVSVHKVGYFADRPCIFSPKGCENAIFKEVADLRSESIMCLHYRRTQIN